MPTDLDTLVDELYALPLDRFVPERAVLVKQLRAEGRREDAAMVAALTKPSIVAWAVNQVVRALPDAATTLWAAGDAVLDAQSRVVSGDAAGAELREAIDTERRALAPLVDAARGLMTTNGRFLGEQNVLPVSESLHAAAIDPTARPQVAEGRLTKPLRLTGLEAAVAASPTSTSRIATRERDPAATRERIEEREEVATQTEAERRRAERERRGRLQAAQRALVRAERARDKARERIAATVADREQALAEITAAEQRLEAAHAGLEAVEERLAAAHDALEDAEDGVDRARTEVEET